MVFFIWSPQSRGWGSGSGSLCNVTAFNRTEPGGHCCSRADQQEWREITFLIPQVTKSSLGSAPIGSEPDEPPGVYSGSDLFTSVFSNLRVWSFSFGTQIIRLSLLVAVHSSDTCCCCVNRTGPESRMWFFLRPTDPWGRPQVPLCVIYSVKIVWSRSSISLWRCELLLFSSTSCSLKSHRHPPPHRVTRGLDCRVVTYRSSGEAALCFH